MTVETEKARLRKYLNPSIKGPNTDALIESIASATNYMVSNIEAINEQVFISTASGSFLDDKLAGYGLTRPENVGLSDETFRKLGIDVINMKQIRYLIGDILNVMYGDEYTKATARSSICENYNLAPNDNLFIIFDDTETIEIIFKEDQFQNITQATAQEVADVIVKTMNALGKNGFAYVKNEGLGNFVMLLSTTIGPSSSVQVLGGSAQQKLQFPSLQPTTNLAGTTWSIKKQSTGKTRLTHVSGLNPSFGNINVGDYVALYDENLTSENNIGSFTITEIYVDNDPGSYIEYDNDLSTILDDQNVLVQNSDLSISFYCPKRLSPLSNPQYALVFQNGKALLNVFMPACTQIIRRERLGSAHIGTTGVPSIDPEYGPYIFDPSKPYTVGVAHATMTTIAELGDYILEVDTTSGFTNTGKLVLDFGTSSEEGPIPYMNIPSSKKIMISPSYKFQKDHGIGSTVDIIEQNSPYEPRVDGLDFQFYITDMISGRSYVQSLIELIRATGIVINFIIIYGNDIGLGKAGTENSEKYWIWS